MLAKLRKAGYSYSGETNCTSLLLFNSKGDGRITTKQLEPENIGKDTKIMVVGVLETKILTTVTSVCIILLFIHI